MSSRGSKIVLGMLLASGMQVTAVWAESSMKALPTLLIKGEVVSVDMTDPAAALLKVKDRYGFETPILLTQETKITQGEAAVAPSNLSSGTAVEVEYNFDVNTAKRHAVSVKVASAAATPATVPQVVEPTPAPAEPMVEPVAPSETDTTAAPAVETPSTEDVAPPVQ